MNLRPAVRVAWSLLLLAVALSAQLAPGAPEVDAATLARAVTIYRDTWGVPHCYGPTDPSVVFGYVYAQAEDNFWQIEDNYIAALGRAAEVHGERMLESDLLNRQLEIARLSQAEYTALEPDMRRISSAAAAALNYFVARNGRVKPRLIERFEPWHVLAFGRYATYQLFLARQAGLRPDEPRGAARELTAESTAGSNAWAIAPTRSASGYTM